MLNNEEMEKVKKLLKEIEKDLASMSKEDRLKFDKQVSDIVEDYHKSDHTEDREKIKKIFAEFEARRNKAKREFFE
jgi:uncharacterized secreted protein with C-terminal beta-propeller domain